jgi:hypothetical protein
MKKRFGILLLSIVSAIFVLRTASSAGDSVAVTSADSGAQQASTAPAIQQEDQSPDREERMTVWAVAVVLLGGLVILLDRKRREVDRDAGIG